MTNILRAIYFLFHVGLGCVFAFLNPYLKSQGFLDDDISYVFFLGSLCGAVGVPLFWGYLVDRTGKPQLILKILTFGTLIGVIPLLFLNTFWPFISSFFIYSFCSIGIMGIVDALASTYAKENNLDFGRLRLFAPAGWMVGSVLLGAYLEHYGSEGVDNTVIMGMIISFALLFMVTLGMKKTALDKQERPKWTDLTGLFSDKKMMLFYVMVFFNFIALAAYMGSYSLLVQDNGHGTTVIGLTHAVGTLSEVILIFFFDKIKRLIGVHWIIISSIVVSIIRWVIVANTSSAYVLVGIQVLHSEIGLFTLACVSFITDNVPKKIVVTAQTIFYTLTYGIGLFLGGIMNGNISKAEGNYSTIFLIAAGIHIIPLILSIYNKSISKDSTVAVEA